MVNLYPLPLRSTKPKELPIIADNALINQNISHISQILQKYPSADILLAYGNNVDNRQYTKSTAKQLIKCCAKTNVIFIACINLNRVIHDIPYVCHITQKFNLSNHNIL